MLTELILEAAVYEIVRKNIETGKAILPYQAEADAIENEHRKFRLKYGGGIHAAFVDA